MECCACSNISDQPTSGQRKAFDRQTNYARVAPVAVVILLFEISDKGA